MERVPVINGYIFIHSTPGALRTHLSWAVSDVLRSPINFSWEKQDYLPGTWRTVYPWSSIKPGMGAALAAVLRSWEQVRFEVTEDSGPASDGARWLYTPALGIYHAQTDTAGNIVLTENRLRDILERYGNTAASISKQIRISLGEAWDEELEPYRSGSYELRAYGH